MPVSTPCTLALVAFLLFGSGGLTMTPLACQETDKPQESEVPEGELPKESAESPAEPDREIDAEPEDESGRKGDADKSETDKGETDSRSVGPPAPGGRAGGSETKTISGVDRSVDPAADQADIVLLKNRSAFKGRVIENGDNSITIEYRGGSKKIFKRDIDDVHFWLQRPADRKLDSDLVVFRDGHEVRGTVRETTSTVEVTLESGARATYNRSRIRRVVYRDEVVVNTSRYYTKQLGEQIEVEIRSLLRAEAPEVVSSHEEFLIECGIFAIESVQKVWDAMDTAQRETLGGASMRRILRAYRLRELVTSDMELTDPSIYKDLTWAEPKTKEAVLKLIFPRHSEESIDLALYLIQDESEDVRVRSIAIEMLRRMHRNRALVELHNANLEKNRDIAFVAAVALARNRIFFGVPTLIDALELGGSDDREFRGVIADVLRDSTGEDFGYHVDRTPDARQIAIVRWREWWEKSREDLEEQSYLVLQNRELLTPERQEAVALWKEAHRLLTSQRLQQAEAYLRRAAEVDPTYFRAHLSLAVLLYTTSGSPAPAEGDRQELEARRAKLRAERIAEAERILKQLSDQALPDLRGEDRSRVHLELANVLFLTERPAEALAEYENALSVDGRNVRAMSGAGKCHWLLATERNELSAGERRIEAQAALQAFRTAREELRETLRSIRVLGIDDLPNIDDLPFRRRDFNRNALSIRREFERDIVDLSLQAARAQTLKGDREAAVTELVQGLEDLENSFELDDARELEIDLRCFLGSTYEALEKRQLAVQQYSHVLRELDRTHKQCRRALARIHRATGKEAGAGEPSSRTRQPARQVSQR